MNLMRRKRTMTTAVQKEYEHLDTPYGIWALEYLLRWKMGMSLPVQKSDKGRYKNIPNTLRPTPGESSLPFFFFW